MKNEILFSNTAQIEEAKNDIIDITKVKNEIQFIKNVTQGKLDISPTELNFILELLFYIKKKGNQVGHPNLEPEKNINLINEENGIKSIDKIIKDEALIKGNVHTEQDLSK